MDDQMKPTPFRTIHRVPLAVAAGLMLMLAAAGCDRDPSQPEPAATADVVPPVPPPVADLPAPVPTAVTPMAQSSGAAERGAVLAGGPVPTGFVAWSVTFVSDRQAYALGDAPCHRPPCTSVVRTLDGGRSWRGVQHRARRCLRTTHARATATATGRRMLPLSALCATMPLSGTTAWCGP